VYKDIQQTLNYSCT